MIRLLTALLCVLALTGCGTSFDLTMDRPDGGEQSESKRCSSCLGSGKARYISGKTSNSYSEPPCSRCGGSGWEQ